jgi:hypothetical protein
LFGGIGAPSVVHFCLPSERAPYPHSAICRNSEFTYSVTFSLAEVVLFDFQDAIRKSASTVGWSRAGDPGQLLGQKRPAPTYLNSGHSRLRLRPPAACRRDTVPSTAESLRRGRRCTGRTSASASEHGGRRRRGAPWRQKYLVFVGPLEQLRLIDPVLYDPSCAPHCRGACFCTSRSKPTGFDGKILPCPIKSSVSAVTPETSIREDAVAATVPDQSQLVGPIIINPVRSAIPSAARNFLIPRFGKLNNRVVLLLNIFDRTNLIRPEIGIGVFQAAYGPRSQSTML